MMICGAEFKAQIVCEEAIRRAAKSSKKGEKGEQRRAEKSREEQRRDDQNGGSLRLGVAPLHLRPVVHWVRFLL